MGKTDIIIILLLFLFVVVTMAWALDELQKEKRNHEKFKSCITHNQKNILACEFLGADFNKLKGE